MKKSSVQRGSSISIASQKSSNNQNQNQNEGNLQGRSQSSNNKPNSLSQSQWTPERSATSYLFANSSQGLVQAKFNQVAQMLTSSSFQGLAQQQQQLQSRSPLIKDTTNTSHIIDIQNERQKQIAHHHDQSISVSPMRNQNNQQQNISQINALSSNISRNQSHRSSSSTSFVNVLKTTGAQSEKDKEKKYIEKIKILKSENKKLKTLLKESEKLFYQKLQETKKESQNLSNLFKQLWPLIKNKVKDPTLLLKTVNGISMDDDNNEQQQKSDKQQKAIFDELQSKLQQYKMRETTLRDELQYEQEKRQKAEAKVFQLSGKLQELKAFEQTMQSFMVNTKEMSTRLGQSNNSKLALQAKSSFENNTKASSSVGNEREEPIPSFMKAMACYQSEDVNLSSKESDIDRADSLSSGVAEEIQRRYSDISIGSKNVSKIVRQQSNDVIYDNTTSSNDLLIIESFGDHSNNQNQASKEHSFGKKIQDIKHSVSSQNIQQNLKQQKRSDGTLKNSINQGQSNDGGQGNNQGHSSFLQLSTQNKGSSTQRQLTNDELNIYKMLIQNNLGQADTSRKSQVIQQNPNNQNILKSFLIQQTSGKTRQMSPF